MDLTDIHELQFAKACNGGKLYQEFMGTITYPAFHVQRMYNYSLSGILHSQGSVTHLPSTTSTAKKCTLTGWDSLSSLAKKKMHRWGSSVKAQEKRRENLASKAGKWTGPSQDAEMFTVLAILCRQFLQLLDIVLWGKLSIYRSNSNQNYLGVVYETDCRNIAFLQGCSAAYKLRNSWRQCNVWEIIL